MEELYRILEAKIKASGFLRAGVRVIYVFMTRVWDSQHLGMH